MKEIDNEKDGWAISGFDIYTAYEGIEKSDFSEINVYPDPVTDLSVIDLTYNLN